MQPNPAPNRWPASPIPAVSGSSPEADVLIACVRSPSDPLSADSLRVSLARITDWDALTDAALTHEMAGLLYRRVSELVPDAVPEAVLESWRARSAKLALRSLRMQRALVALCGALTAADVPVLAFKGPVIAEQLHGDPGARHFSDLDVVVHPRDVRTARGVALGLGYRDIDSIWLQANGLPEEHSAEQEIELQHPQTKTWLEVHWRIGPRYEENSLLADGLFERASKVEILGREVACLGRHDVVLALVVHAATHDWLRIEDAASLAAALAGMGDSEARDLEALATANGCLRRLRIGVLLLAELGSVSQPDGLASRARADRSALRLANTAAARLVASLGAPAPDEEPGPRGHIRRALWEARTLDTRKEYAWYVWRRLFRATEYDRPEDGATRRGLAGALAAQVRRQKRLWRGDRS